MLLRRPSEMLCPAAVRETLATINVFRWHDAYPLNILKCCAQSFARIRSLLNGTRDFERNSNDKEPDTVNTCDLDDSHDNEGEWVDVVNVKDGEDKQD